VKQQQNTKERAVTTQETIKIIAMGSENFHITQGMLEVDEDTM
jgi:hypothetical protein